MQEVSFHPSFALSCYFHVAELGPVILSVLVLKHSPLPEDLPEML